MTVDAFTLVAQVVNFVILLLLLRRFLYRPVVRVMREREERIAAEHEQAASARADAERQAEQLRAERAELERGRDARLAAIEQQAQRHRQELFEQARRELAEAQQRWQASLLEGRTELLAGLRDDLGGVLYAALNRALGDLADLTGGELDARVAHAFAARLGELEAAQLDPFRQALATDPQLRVASAVPLPDEARAALERAVRAQLSERAELRFEARPELLAGVALEVRDHRLSWNLRRYLDDLERDFHVALERSAGGSSAAASAGGSTAAAAADPGGSAGSAADTSALGPR